MATVVPAVSTGGSGCHVYTIENDIWPCEIELTLDLHGQGVEDSAV